MKKALLLIFSASATLGFAETFAAGSAAAPWLKLPNSARSAAMGEAVVAVADDVNSLSVNPAGLSGLNGMQASLLHHAYVVDSSIEHAAFGMSMGGQAGAAIGIDFLNFGSVDKYKVDSAGALVADGTINPTSMAINAAYGKAFGLIGVGLNVKMVSQSLDGSSSSSAFGGDLGVLWYQQEKEGLSAGLAIQNFGSQLEGASLPLNYKVGGAYKLGLADSSNALLFAIDANVPSADAGASTMSLGAEFAGGQLWALRGGYKVAGNGGSGGLSVGAGLSYSIASLDYAFVNQGVLGNSNEVSLTLKF